MAVTLNSSQVQQNFGAALDQALRGEDVIVERYGTPRAVLVDYARYQGLVAAAQAPGRINEAAVAYRVAGDALIGENQVDALADRLAVELGGRDETLESMLAALRTVRAQHARLRLGELEAVLRSLPPLSADEAAGFAGDLAAARAELRQDEAGDLWAS